MVGQVISFPLTILSSGLTTIIAPTGSPDASAIIGVVVVLLLTQVLTLLIQSVAIVVQSTATALVYVDCRMRHEGLDLDLLAYVERRDTGATVLQDPYLEHIGRAIAPRPTGYLQAYPQQGYPQPVPAQGYAQYPQPVYPPQQYAQPTYPPPAGYVQTPPPPPLPEADAAPPPPTTWAAPGTTPERRDRESPWSPAGAGRRPQMRRRVRPSLRLTRVVTRRLMRERSDRASADALDRSASR